MRKIRNYFYKFTDGHFFWYAGKLKGEERKIAIWEHGAIVQEIAQ